MCSGVSRWQCALLSHANLHRPAFPLPFELFLFAFLGGGCVKQSWYQRFPPHLRVADLTEALPRPPPPKKGTTTAPCKSFPFLGGGGMPRRLRKCAGWHVRGGRGQGRYPGQYLIKDRRVIIQGIVKRLAHGKRRGPGHLHLLVVGLVGQGVACGERPGDVAMRGLERDPHAAAGGDVVMCARHTAHLQRQ